MRWALHHCPLHDAAPDLLARCEAAATSLAICLVPRRADEVMVASNETIIRIAVASLLNGVTKAKPKSKDAKPCTDTLSTKS